uniref:U22-Hypotoxin-Hsp1a_1 n=1 Tax=Hypochilus sp. SGP-2016 TaxID=1905178 RepID=A0A482ZE75_9ARAC
MKYAIALMLLVCVAVYEAADLKCGSQTCDDTIQCCLISGNTAKCSPMPGIGEKCKQKSELISTGVYSKGCPCQTGSTCETTGSGCSAQHRCAKTP